MKLEECLLFKGLTFGLCKYGFCGETPNALNFLFQQQICQLSVSSMPPRLRLFCPKLPAKKQAQQGSRVSYSLICGNWYNSMWEDWWGQEDLGQRQM